MRFSLSGIHVPHRKNTADMAAVRMAPPELVTIPTSMHIGKPASPSVKVGDKVFVGTLLASQDGFVSAPVYSSVSGTVKSVSPFTVASGQTVTAITVASDGNMTPDPSIEPPVIDSREALVAAIRSSGTVGLGGAGFPTYVKFSVPEGKEIDELIVNGAECEPYITSDTRTMIDKSADMRRAIDTILRFMPIKRVIIGIESNKRAAIESVRRMAEGEPRIDVRVLKSVYPQGGEKVLIYHLTGKVVPAGKLPLDVGCIIVNCTTLACIGNYIATGMPLVSKCVTVDGGAVASPKNVIAPIGTAISEVIAFTGGFKSEPAKVLLGGPMMGYSITSLDLPIMKNTNAVIAFDESEAKPKRETACIRCGSCAAHCPLCLNPAAFMRAYKRGDVAELERLRIDICMECGCCSYICPAGQPLVEVNKLSKQQYREYLAEKKAKEGAVNGK